MNPWWKQSSVAALAPKSFIISSSGHFVLSSMTRQCRRYYSVHITSWVTLKRMAESSSHTAPWTVDPWTEAAWDVGSIWLPMRRLITATSGWIRGKFMENRWVMVSLLLSGFFSSHESPRTDLKDTEPLNEGITHHLTAVWSIGK